jgi:hypothetical protein
LAFLDLRCSTKFYRHELTSAPSSATQTWLESELGHRSFTHKVTTEKELVF